MNATQLRVCYVIDSLSQGGAERSLIDLIPELQRLGVDSRLVLLEGGGALEPLALERRIRTSSLPGRNDASKTTALLRLLRSAPTDLIHTSLFRSSMAGRMAGAVTRTPVITSLTGESFSPADNAHLSRRARAAKPMYRAVDVWTGRHLTAHFHAVSAAVRDYHVESYRLRPESITVVPRGRNGARLQPPSCDERIAARVAIGVPSSALAIVHIGRQDPVKNLSLLLHAVAALHSKGADAHLVQAGRAGSETGELRHLTRTLGIEDRVHWVGFLEDVRPALHAADLLALPSLAEGMSGSIIEAMATGLPVLASDIRANADLVVPDETGLLAPAHDVDAWVNAIIRLGNPEVGRRLGTNGRRHFEASYTLESSAAAMVALYRSVLEERS